MAQCSAERPAEGGGVTYCILEKPHRGRSHADDYGHHWLDESAEAWANEPAPASE